VTDVAESRDSPHDSVVEAVSAERAGAPHPSCKEDTHLPFDLPAVCRKKVSVAFDGGLLSSDGGVHGARREAL